MGICSPVPPSVVRARYGRSCSLGLQCFQAPLSSGDLDPKPYPPRRSHPSHWHPHPFHEPCLPLPLLYSHMLHPVASLPPFTSLLPLQDKGPTSSLLPTSTSSSPSSFCPSFFIITGPTFPPPFYNLHPGCSPHTSLPLSTPSLWLLIHGLSRLLPSSAPLHEVARADGIVQVPFSLRDLSQTADSANLL